MEKRFIVEVAEYDFRKETTKEQDEERFDLTQEGVSTYEDFRIKGIYRDKEDAIKRFTTPEYYKHLRAHET